jgi:hypothetical protein
MERFYCKKLNEVEYVIRKVQENQVGLKLNEVEGKEQYCVEISNMFAALENLDTDVDVNKAWETIREYIKISAKESLVIMN